MVALVETAVDQVVQLGPVRHPAFPRLEVGNLERVSEGGQAVQRGKDSFPKQDRQVLQELEEMALMAVLIQEAAAGAVCSAAAGRLKASWRPSPPRCL